MKRFVIKTLIFIMSIEIILVGINIYVDPANLYHDLSKEMARVLNEGKTVEVNFNYDERLFQRERIPLIKENQYSTVVFGSSHMMYFPWDDDTYCAGVSGACLYDYIALMGVIDRNNVSFSNVIIGVDPWIFSTHNTDTRYTSLQDYLDYEIKLMNGESGRDIKFDDSTLTMDKIGEAKSPVYFQASIHALMNGEAKLGSTSKRITIADNSKIGDIQKRIPNGVYRTTNKSMAVTPDQLDKVAANIIANGDWYQSVNDISLSEKKIKLFEQFIASLKKRGIRVTLYLPAWYPAFYQYFTAQKPRSGVLQIEDYLVEYTKREKIELRGSYDPTLSGVDESDFFDTLHLKGDSAKKQFEYVR